MIPLENSMSIDHTSTATRPISEQHGGRPRPKSGWLAITGLLFLAVLPVIGGVLRLGEVGSGSAINLPWTSTVAIVAHIVAMTIFCLVGAFQFSPALRGRSGWHRTAGRVILPAGFIAALASMWLAVFFNGPSEEFALAMVRLVFALPMAVFLVMAVVAITRRDFTAHGAWMTRAFAIAVTGGTQALVIIVWSIPFGDVDTFGETWLVGAGFVINSVVAELLILRRSRRQMRDRAQRDALRDERAVRSLNTSGAAS
ncbi:MAG: DUF2306 domain-containing protein [Microbacteriaceae bacterium]